MKIKDFFKRITGIKHLEYMGKIQEERIKNLTNLLLRQREFAEQHKKIVEKEKEIKQLERKLEATIDQQYLENQRLKTQLEFAINNKKGDFYVFNPQHGMPHKIYKTYADAMKDAESVAKISNGQKIYVLKIVAGIQINKEVADYSQYMVNDEIPF